MPRKKGTPAKHKNDSCPNCGYCPHCGRAAAPSVVPVPVYPPWHWWTVPYYPQPYYYPITTTAAPVVNIPSVWTISNDLLAGNATTIAPEMMNGGGTWITTTAQSS